MAGPLEGLRVLEIAGMGPGPFCGMLLADLGATVIRVDRPSGHERGGPVNPQFNVLTRSRKSICVDLKKPGAADVVLKLADASDAMYEGFRP